MSPSSVHPGMITDPEELWKKVMKWSLAAFLATVILLLLVGLLFGT